MTGHIDLNEREYEPELTLSHANLRPRPSHANHRPTALAGERQSNAGENDGR